MYRRAINKLSNQEVQRSRSSRNHRGMHLMYTMCLMNKKHQAVPEKVPLLHQNLRQNLRQIDQCKPNMMCGLMVMSFRWDMMCKMTHSRHRNKYFVGMSCSQLNNRPCYRSTDQEHNKRGGLLHQNLRQNHRQIHTYNPMMTNYLAAMSFHWGKMCKICHHMNKN